MKLVLVIALSFNLVFSTFADDRTYSFRVTVETSGDTSYIFEPLKGPPLTLDKEGAIADVIPVNKALTILGLTPVSRTVPEQESITGKRWDRAKYIWEDYPSGQMEIKRSLCRYSVWEHNHQDCISKVLIRAAPTPKPQATKVHKKKSIELR